MNRTTNAEELDFADFTVGDWSDPDYRFAAKKEDIAIALTGLLHQQAVSRAELARRLNWKRSRVTRALSGKENLTLRTLNDIIAATGYDFDLVMRLPGHLRTMQPWETQSITTDLMHLRDNFAAQVAEAEKTCAEVKEMLKILRTMSRVMFRRQWAPGPKITTLVDIATSDEGEGYARLASAA